LVFAFLSFRFLITQPNSLQGRVSAVRGLSTTASTTTTTTTKNAATMIKKNVAVPGLKNGMDYVQIGDSDLIASKVCSK
jgi:hypothetical protein